jgi:hypothetical protein
MEKLKPIELYRVDWEIEAGRAADGIRQAKLDLYAAELRYRKACEMIHHLTPKKKD